MMTKFDDEIQEVEARLVRERAALVHQAEDLGHTAREAAVSPKGLLAAAAVAFMIDTWFSEVRRWEKEIGATLANDMEV